MTTSTTSTVLDQTTDAGFRVWIAEIIAQLVATCGLTQTADSGQVNTATVIRPAITTAAGYSIFEFNDTLNGTKPVFIKLEYGAASAITTPQMWITIGTGSNGAGTLTGTVSTRVACCNAQPSTSTTASYTSRFVYNSTYGVCGMIWKQNGNSYAGTNGCIGGFYIFRSNDNTGAASGDSINCITNSSSSTGTASSGGYMQCLSYLTSTAYPPLLTNGAFWPATSGFTPCMPFQMASTTYAGNSYLVPVNYMSPVPSISAFSAIALIAEAANGSTFSAAIVGSTPLTFLSVGQIFGGTYLGSANATLSTFCMLWQ